MDGIDVKDLRLILAVPGELSIHAVAQRLGTSASNVSQRLAKMEHVVGEKLVHRPGEFRLTKAGQRLLQFAQAFKAEFDSFTEDIESSARNVERLQIMANASLMIDDLPLVVESLLLERPELLIEMTEGSFAEIIKAVEAGEVDAGLLNRNHQVPGLQFIPYKVDRVCLLVPISHPLAHGDDKISFSIAADYPFIGSTTDNQFSVFMDTIARKEKIKIDYKMRVSSFEAQGNLVAKTSIGIALMLESVAKRFIPPAKMPIDPTVKIVHLTNSWAEENFFLVIRDRTENSAACVDFMRLLCARHAPSTRRIS